MKTIILVRHGESETNVQKVFTGQLNAALTQKGKTQAQLMAQLPLEDPYAYTELVCKLMK